ncbi:TPA: TVP38/TMEM64 family protein [Klebsiella pneumoniae]|nr:TVP38/TMEM64 family protein [Klebsiella pneumoniae]HBX3377016.1 TVP38/TMEM64 family protein [Klebsiella pneumoniae]HBX8003148.1 TVP38/TMEM64 family protein [Klebsiella pneumoniae]
MAVVPWRAYLSAAESDGVSLPGSAAGQRVYRRLGAAGRAGLICADDPPGDRRSAAGFPDYPGERRPVRRLLGRGAVVVQRYGRGRALLLHRQSAGARSGGETHRPRGAAQCRRLFHRFGPQTILVCRLLPFVPFDPVSYAAGLTSLRFWPFMLATGVGQLPATIVYSWAGSLLTGGTFWLATGLSLLFALAVVISIAKNIYRERHKRSSP